jgi:hypothetical protein
VWFDFHFISFIDRDGDHFFMCFLAFCTSSFEKVLCLFKERNHVKQTTEGKREDE